MDSDLSKCIYIPEYMVLGDGEVCMVRNVGLLHGIRYIDEVLLSFVC